MKILSSEFAEQAKDLAGSLDINTLIQEEAAGITEGKGDLKKLYAEEVGGYYNGKDLYLDENYTQKNGNQRRRNENGYRRGKKSK